MVLGERDKVIYGKGHSEDILCGKKFRISAKSFYQVNPVQTEILYKKAIDAAGFTGKEYVIDAYCGIGTIGIVASDHVDSVVGVELNRDAVRDAIGNAKANNIKNIRFVCEDAGRFMAKLADAARRDSSVRLPDVVLMDPPRSGSDEAFLSSLVKMSPKTVVYVSCNPVTLERDVKWLEKKGYKAKGVWPVDMFPFTEHTEVVCLLSKLKAEKHIEVEIEMDELDLTAAESKATYAEIKQYVLDKTGLKVSQLYIAKIKRKHGLIERTNYNLGEKESKSPQVPPEKEQAIEDALIYFKMI